MLDRELARYGPETEPARKQLRQIVAAVIEKLWPTDGSKPVAIGDMSITTENSALYDAVKSLSPSDVSQRSLKAEALQTCSAMARDRWRLSQQSDNALPTPFLIVLAFWFSVLFASFGLFAPRNITTIGVLLICGLSVAGAVFLIVDLSQPLDGMLRISSSSLRDALASLGQ